MGAFRRRGLMLLLLPAFLLLFSLTAGKALAEEGGAWRTAAEAEEARALAEREARAVARESAAKSEAAEEAEAAAEEAEEAAEEKREAAEKARSAAESAEPGERARAERTAAEAERAAEAAREDADGKRAAAEEARKAAEEAAQALYDAAMVLKTATEAAVRMANRERVDDSLILASFTPGEKFTGAFNENRDPLYVRLILEKSARVHMRTEEATVSISVLDSGGSTILTLVPSSSGKSSVCSLEAGEYTLMIAAMGTGKRVTVSVDADPDAPRTEAPEETDGTGMETLVEFD